MFCEKVAHGRLYVEQQYGDEADWCLIQGSIEVCALSYFHPVTGRWKSTDGPQIIMFVCCHSDDIHFKTNPKIPGIDLNSVRLLFETLSKPAFSDLLEQVLLDTHLPVVYVYIYVSMYLYILCHQVFMCIFILLYTYIYSFMFDYLVSNMMSIHFFRLRRVSRVCWSRSCHTLLRTWRPWGSTSSCPSVRLCTSPRTTSASPSLWPWPFCAWTPTPAKS